MIVIGIDPGLKGAVASISTSGQVIRVFRMPIIKVGKKNVIDANLLCNFFEKRAKAIRHIFIERVHSMPGQGVASCFTFGMGYGILQGLCAGLHLPHTLVLPTTWKKVMCRDVPKGKGASILVAKRMWPDVNLLPTPKSKKDDHGIADALCIAEYGRRTIIGGIL